MSSSTTSLQQSCHDLAGIPAAARSLQTGWRCHTAVLQSISWLQMAESILCSGQGKVQGSLKQHVEAQGLAQISDPKQIGAWISEVLEAFPKELEQYRGGKTKLQGHFSGCVLLCEFATSHRNGFTARDPMQTCPRYSHNQHLYAYFAAVAAFAQSFCGAAPRVQRLGVSIFAQVCSAIWLPACVPEASSLELPSSLQAGDEALSGQGQPISHEQDPDRAAECIILTRMPTSKDPALAATPGPYLAYCSCQPKPEASLPTRAGRLCQNTWFLL